MSVSFHLVDFRSIHVCMLSSFSYVWLFVTLWAAAHQGPLSTGFSRQEYWSGLPCPLPGDPPNPGIQPASPALQADSLPLSHWGSPQLACVYSGFLKRTQRVFRATPFVYLFLASTRDKLGQWPGILYQRGCYSHSGSVGGGIVKWIQPVPEWSWICFLSTFPSLHPPRSL